MLLSAVVRRQLSRQDYDRGIETGGPLFGFYERRRPVVCELAAAVREGSADELRFAVVDIDAIAAARRAATGWRLCGIWHTHPTPSWADPGELGLPSEGDLRTWRNWWEDEADAEMPAFAGVIVSEAAGCGRGRGWQAHAINAWLVEAASGNAVLCEARVEVEPAWDR